MSSARALIFDLDDTLYPERWFLLSGFTAVAAAVERDFGIRRHDALTVLTAELAAGNRASALQRLCAHFDLPPGIVPGLVQIIRGHVPRLRLPAPARRTLSLIKNGWRTAILTNGDPEIQARKVAALNVQPLVDAVLYATHHSQHGGKPDPACFLAASELLGVPPARCVFVGNDPWRDIEGASRVGMRTIRLISWTDESAAGSREADAVVRRIAAVPRRAGRLLEGERLCA